MKAIILSAGRGNRLRPLTDKIPKPLVRVGHEALIEHHIKNLSLAGFESIVINTAHLGKKIQDYLGNGSRYNIPIEYSHEEEQALETGGGIAYALPLLGEQTFLAISADIYCEIPFNKDFQLNHSRMHLVMVDNPTHHPQGDFTASSLGIAGDEHRYTYSGIAYIEPALFRHEKRTYPLVETIHECIDQKNISAEVFHGAWFDVGTATRLHAANKYALGI
ncbi:MAG: N-acetylmuramate alpha-1-phosphate uridylyltransferase MurU [Pseudomonadota bacterium]